MWFTTLEQIDGSARTAVSFLLSLPQALGVGMLNRIIFTISLQLLVPSRVTRSASAERIHGNGYFYMCIQQQKGPKQISQQKIDHRKSRMPIRPTRNSGLFRRQERLASQETGLV